MGELPDPNGQCWCGCSERPGPGRYFKPGHDSFAQNKVRIMEYGTEVVRFLMAHGYGPGQKNVREEYRRRKEMH